MGTESVGKVPVFLELNDPAFENVAFSQQSGSFLIADDIVFVRVKRGRVFFLGFFRVLKKKRTYI